MRFVKRTSRSPPSTSRTSISPAWPDALGLDAGCGKGRFTRVLARYLKTVVALDGSEAVHAAVHNLRDQENVGVVRADLRLPLFAPQSFDFISSLGVLHHLDDPREGFERLAQYLAPGGQMLVYLYSRPDSFNTRGSGSRPPPRRCGVSPSDCPIRSSEP